MEVRLPSNASFPLHTGRPLNTLKSQLKFLPATPPPKADFSFFIWSKSDRLRRILELPEYLPLTPPPPPPRSCQLRKWMARHLLRGWLREKFFCLISASLVSSFHFRPVEKARLTFSPPKPNPRHGSPNSHPPLMVSPFFCV